MFELFVGGFAIAAISFLGAAAALVKPYRPFDTRLGALRAMGLSLLCALAATLGAAVLSETPAAFDPAVHLAESEPELSVEREPEPAPAPRASRGPSRADRIAAEAAALAEARAAAEAKADAAGPEIAPGRAAVSAGPPPPSAEVDALMAAIDAGDWPAATAALAALREGGYALSDALATAERAARARVRSIPPSDPAAARDGYALLAAIDPADRTYPAKAQSYAAAAERAEAVDPLEKLVRREDPQAGVTWLEHPARPGAIGARPTILLAIGREGDGPPFLQMRTVYSGRTWLFVDSVAVVYGGDERTLAIGWFEREQDAAAYEWRDERPDPSQVEILRGLARAENAILRFRGMQDGRDEPFARTDRQALADMLAAWDAMTGD